DQIESALTALERQHRSPKARLKALVRLLAEQANTIAPSGFPPGTPCSELAKQAEESDPLAAPLMQIPLDWAEQQFRTMGRRDAPDPAVALLVFSQGSAGRRN